MNLRYVHAVLIALSAGLAVLFGIWSLSLYARQGGIGALIAGIGAFAASLALIVYDRWFLRKTRWLR